VNSDILSFSKSHFVAVSK